MSITAERKTEVIGEYATKKDDTGSPEVQVAMHRGLARRWRRRQHRAQR